MFGWTEILIVVAIVVLLFGSSRIPALARALGESVHEFRTAIGNDQDGFDDRVAEDTPPS